MEKKPLLAVHPGNANLPWLAEQTVDFRCSLTYGLVAPATLPKLLEGKRTLWPNPRNYVGHATQPKQNSLRAKVLSGKVQGAA